MTRLCVLLLILLLTVSARAQNVALGRPVTASGALWPGLPASNLTDGNRLGTGTIAHPATGVSTLGFYFQTDLGAEIALNRIVLYNRSDCCPERLTNFRVTLTLATAANVTLESLHCDDLAPWPETADGNGYSLVLANPTAPTAAASWRTSTAIGGNPGATDATTFTGTPLADADADGLKMLAEYFLFTSDTNGASGPSCLIAGRTADGRATPSPAASAPTTSPTSSRSAPTSRPGPPPPPAPRTSTTATAPPQKPGPPTPPRSCNSSASA